jgi:dihydrosphingosine 1-phosphate phosphatase
MIHVLASGVFFSGFFKDMLCLPRPLSPPLQRITMSGSAALEYGFPSTHSTNAISVAVYTLFVLNYHQPDISPTTSIALQTIAYFYGVSIVLGRVYCGMHGFLDVICGSLLGAALSLVQCLYGEAFNNMIHSNSNHELLIVILGILVLVRIHPEPVDDCPCFDDSVAFAGVMIGAEFANWHYAKTTFAWSQPYPATVPFNLREMGWFIVTLRIMLGVVVIFVWRGTMKPTLLRILPPIFRVIESLGLSLPRRFFMQASEYKRVPKQKHDDNIIPSVSEIPRLLTSFRRRRAVSIGPQSEADAYETMAYREKKRRDSLTSLSGRGPASPGADKAVSSGYFTSKDVANGSAGNSSAPNLSRLRGKTDALPVATSPIAVNASENSVQHGISDSASTNQEDRDLFTNLQKPRVRYDVEVVTKLIVYSGSFSHP